MAKPVEPKLLAPAPFAKCYKNFRALVNELRSLTTRLR